MKMYGFLSEKKNNLFKNKKDKTVPSVDTR